MLWTRLHGSALWTQVEIAYGSDPRRHYHNLDHLERLYFHAEKTWGLTYDADLDLAFAGHDAIWDEHPLKESRSADWIEEKMGAPLPNVRAQIMKTAEAPPQDQDNRIVLCDLGDMTCPDRSEENQRKITLESMAMYGLSERAADEKAVKFLASLDSALADEHLAGLPAWERDGFRAIRAGAAGLRVGVLRRLETSGGPVA